MVLNVGIKRPVFVVAILLAVLGYAATKEWEWQADADPMPLLRVSQSEWSDTADPRDASWGADAVTVERDQIFQD